MAPSSTPHCIPTACGRLIRSGFVPGTGIPHDGPLPAHGLKVSRRVALPQGVEAPHPENPDPAATHRPLVQGPAQGDEAS